MASNLCADRCVKCDYKVKLADLRGQPLEFRRRGHYPPQMGVRFDCDCGKSYFVWMERKYRYWSEPEDAFKDEIELPDGRTFPNKEKGRFVVTHEIGGKTETIQTGFYRIDMSFYHTFNDEDLYDEDPDPGNPNWLCEDEAEDARLEN